jgi:hypothetical protein
MGVLQNKIILVVSPQEWGTMFLSKHHYAIELAKRGNKVYFLNPPDQKNKLPINSVSIFPSGIHENLFLIEHRVFFPYWIKFKAFGLFQWLMRFHVPKILKAIGSIPDIIWSFDLGNLYPLLYFPDKSYKIFHPVDEPLTPQSIKAAEGSDVIFSVTKEILSKYSDFRAPKHFIHHGVKDEFLLVFKDKPYQQGNPLKIGYAGNLLRNDIDRDTLLKIVQQQPKCEFHFFGSFEMKSTNIGGTDDAATRGFVDKLKKMPQVKLQGVLNQDALAIAFGSMDAFLVCYDIERDQSKGTNYHKLMEYLATGRVIISNNITTYAGMPDLIQMIPDRANNNALPELFNSIMNRLPEYNSEALMGQRKSFAASNTYKQQLTRIEEIINDRI